MKSSTRVVLGLILIILLLLALALFVFIRKHSPKTSFEVTNATYAGLHDKPILYLVEENETVFVVTSPATTFPADQKSTKTSSSITTSAFTIMTEPSLTTITDDDRESASFIWVDRGPIFCSIPSESQNNENVKCKVQSEDLHADWLKPDFQLPKVPSLIHPLHIQLNITVASKNSPFLMGSMRLFAEVVNDSRAILLDADRQISGLDVEQISIRNCADGQPICINSVTKLMDRKVILLLLNEMLPKDTTILIEISNFETAIFGNPGLFQQMPSAWEKDRAWMLASFFQSNGARSVFPGVDDDFSRATVQFCVKIPDSLNARSNMPEDWKASINGMTQKCFAKTPAISTHQFGFVLFDQMHTITSNSTEISIEVFVGKHLNPVECQWIIKEIEKVLRKMASLTGSPYPVPKLTLVSSALDVDGMSSLGLVLIKETWVEYPKYLLTHTILVRQLVYQWISNVLMVCVDKNVCFQDGFATYLEWTLNADLVTFNVSTHKRFVETKQKLLVLPSERSPSLAYAKDECAERAAMILYMVAHGMGSIQGLIQELGEKFSWRQCVSVKELARAIDAIEPSNAIADTFVKYASTQGYPLLKAEIFSNGSLSIRQEAESSFAVPIELSNEHGATHFVLNATRFNSHFPSSFIFIDPEQHLYARTVYNVENYFKLKHCFLAPSTCGLSRDSIRNAFGDLCWAFMSNRLDSDGRNIPAWHQLFGELSNLTNELGIRDCECCMKRQKESSPRCKWIWRDKCSRLVLAPQKR